MSNFSEQYFESAPPRNVSIRGRVGDIILVPARVSSVGTDDKRSIRLIIDTRGLPSVRVSKSDEGGEMGYLDPTFVYNPHNRFPASMLQHLSDRAPTEVLHEDFLTLGYSEAQAKRFADNSVRLVQDYMCPLEMEFLQKPSSSFRQCVEEGNSAWDRMCKNAQESVKDRQKEMAVYGLDTPLPLIEEEELSSSPSTLPGVMLASGFME